MKRNANAVQTEATKTINKLGFAPKRVEWLGQTTFQAMFRRDADATGLAVALRKLGRTADAQPARFDDDAFVTFVL
jgi:hypothetical protein